jgi:glucose/arabinose dehydrogenase
MKISHIVLFASILLSACAQKGADAPRSDTAQTSTIALNVATIANGLEFPWGIAFMPDGSALVTEKAGRLRHYLNGELLAPISGVPQVLYDGQAGLFDVALHPDFARNGFIYLSYAKGSEQDNGTALVRARLVGNSLKDATEIFVVTPLKKGTSHFGGRILFLPDKTLLLSLGEGFDYKEEAQNPQSDLGKIVHLHDDGTPVLGGVSGGRPEIFTMGHRNVQGLALDKANNIIYEHEHGPRGGDEINILRAGKNYGWPKITYGIGYSGVKISDKVALPGLEQPLIYWVPSIAPSAMTFYDRDLFAQFKGDLLVSALAGQQIRHIDLQNGVVVNQTVLLAELQTRFRNIATAPDGSLWVLTDEPEGKILRLTPKQQ